LLIDFRERDWNTPSRGSSWRVPIEEEGITGEYFEHIRVDIDRPFKILWPLGVRTSLEIIAIRASNSPTAPDRSRGPQFPSALSHSQ